MCRKKNTKSNPFSFTNNKMFTTYTWACIDNRHSISHNLFEAPKTTRQINKLNFPYFRYCLCFCFIYHFHPIPPTHLYAFREWFFFIFTYAAVCLCHLLPLNEIFFYCYNNEIKVETSSRIPDKRAHDIIYCGDVENVGLGNFTLQ